jgi:hypothetical protein
MHDKGRQQLALNANADGGFLPLLLCRTVVGERTSGMSISTAG